MNIFKKLLKRLEADEKCVLATVVEKNGDGPVVLGGRLLKCQGGDRYGTIGGGAIEKQILNTCETILVSGENQIITYDIDVCGGAIKVFYEIFEPREQIFVFGSGNVGRQVIRKLESLGFKIIVIDPVSPEGLNVDLHYKEYELVIEQLIDDHSYVVISTGSHEVDYQILKAIVERGVRPRYFGMLASKKKAQQLLERLEQEIGKRPDKLYSPIGLAIGGESPAEIAISIVAQVLSVRYGVEQVEAMS